MREHLDIYKEEKIKMLKKDFYIHLTDEEEEHINALTSEMEIDRYAHYLIFNKEPKDRPQRKKAIKPIRSMTKANLERVTDMIAEKGFDDKIAAILARGVLSVYKETKQPVEEIIASL